MELIKRITEAKVEKVIAGGGNGSIVLFDLIKNENKFVFYIYCSWRLSIEKEVLTGWNDDSSEDKTTFVSQLKALHDDIIESLDINDLGDLTVRFKSGKVLSVFCDITSNGGALDVMDNWTVCDVSNNQCVNFTNFFSCKSEPFK